MSSQKVTTYRTVNKSCYGIQVGKNQTGWGIEKRGKLWVLLDAGDEVVVTSDSKKYCLEHYIMWYTY